MLLVNTIFDIDNEGTLGPVSYTHLYNIRWCVGLSIGTVIAPCPRMRSEDVPDNSQKRI